MSMGNHDRWRDVPDRPVLAEELKELLRCHVVAVRDLSALKSFSMRCGRQSITDLRFLTNKALDMTDLVSSVAQRDRRHVSEESEAEAAYWRRHRIVLP